MLSGRQSISLAFSVVLCFVCIQILINRRRRGIANSGCAFLILATYGNVLYILLSRLISAILLQICICTGHASTYLWASLQAYVYHAADEYGAAKYLNAHWAVGWKATQLGFFAANVRCIIRVSLQEMFTLTIGPLL